jgi:branched-chain amino acid transport system substrate-binding protein
MNRPKSLGVAAVALAAAVAVALSGCSSSKSSDGSSSGSSSSGSTASALGTPNKATGTPVAVGFISDGKSQAFDLTDELNGGKAAAAYINDYKGGINGHPIDLKQCSALGTPAGTTDCAQQMVTDKVVMVLAGNLSQADAAVDVLSPAGIPTFFNAASSAKTLSDKLVYSLTNPVTYFGTAAAYAKSKGYTKAAILVLDVPGAAGPAKQIGPLVFGNQGAKVDVVAIPAGTADMTPQIQAEEANKPQLYDIVGDSSFCTAAVKAIKTLAIDTSIVLIDRCITSSTAASIPGGYSKVQVVTTAQLTGTGSDFSTFTAALKKYSSSTQPDPSANSGWAPVLGVVDALNTAKIADLTSATIATTIAAAGPTPYPNAVGTTFQCDGKQLPISPNICGAAGIIATSDKDGNLSDYTKLGGPEVYALPAK